jgi:predicted MPP superfamily phosphohydrolase
MFFSNGLLANADNAGEKGYEKYWVQYSDNGSLLFRHISANDSKCPKIIVDKVDVQTIVRPHEYIEEFPVTVCQAEIDNQKPHNIVFKKLNIKTKISNINKISVIGDSGCITEGKILEQNCNRIEEYPFSEIAKNVQKMRPDIIVHVGDYFYSKDECINDDKCKKRPHGDRLDTWKVDFFDNAGQFFNDAPIVFARGNHEACSRGGKGWFTLLDPSINFKKCQFFTTPYTIEFSKFRFLMIDSAYASDSEEKFNELSAADKERTINQFNSQINETFSRMDNDKENIIITHKPIFSKEFRPWQQGLEFEANYLMNKSIDNSEYRNNLKNLKLILSGHTHTGMMIEYKDDGYHFYQAVIGNSGAFLNKANMLKSTDTKVFDKKIVNFFEHKDFGYSELLFGKDGVVSRFKFFKYDGKLIKDSKI